MDENTQPEPNSDELIMQQQRQIEKEVIFHQKSLCGIVFSLFFFTSCHKNETPHLYKPILHDAADVLFLFL